MKKKQKIILSLASGGLRALSCIPLFTFLKQNNIDISEVYGCGGGAVLACTYSMGMSPLEIEKIAKKIWKKEIFKPDYKFILSFMGLPFLEKKCSSAFLKSEPIKEGLRSIFGELRLEQLSPRVTVQATDFLTGEPVILREGLIVDALYASSADFPFLPPIKIGNRWLIDGAFSSPLPIQEAVKKDPEVIITMMYDFVRSKLSTDFLENYVSIFSIFHNTLRNHQLGWGAFMHEGKFINIRVLFNESISMWDVHKIDKILKESQIAVEAKKEEILNAIHRPSE